jgi:predicted acylesterase/phospholipase RssA
VFLLNPLSGLLGFLGSRDHLVPDSGLRRLVKEHLEHVRLEELPIPLHVVAVDVVTGEELLSSGPVIDAVMASAAIPAVLPPVAWGERELMDGGVGNNTLISHAIGNPTPGATALFVTAEAGTRARATPGGFTVAWRLARWYRSAPSRYLRRCGRRSIEAGSGRPKRLTP